MTLYMFRTVFPSFLNSWRRTERPPKTCSVSFQNKINLILVHLVGFTIETWFLLLNVLNMTWLPNMQQEEEKQHKFWCFVDHASQYITNLVHIICFTVSFISCLYMYRAHVLIIRRSKLYYTAFGIIKACVMQFWPPDDGHMCSIHVEAWNKTYCETNFVHQVGYILR